MTDMTIEPASFDITYPVIVVGGGGCGLCAALAVKDAGVDVLILERDSSLLGTTAMSTGLIPAAGTPEQAAREITDNPEQFAADILAKTKGKTDKDAVTTLASESAETVEWLRDTHAIGLHLIDGFLYPGHTAMRMYGMPNRSGGELMGALINAADTAGVDILTDANVSEIIANPDGTVRGVKVERPGGASEYIGCEALVLACCGFAGQPDLVEKYIPEIRNAVFHGHPSNKGDAIRWGEELGADLADMASYQGHAGLAVGHGIPILWPSIMEGGFQVNAEGNRFADETQGYSEQAVKVLEQTDSIAWSVFDERCHQLMTKFDDYQDALKAGAVLSTDTLPSLAKKMKVPESALQNTVDTIEMCRVQGTPDQFGREFSNKPPLNAPFYAAKVTGALFHTQGGLVVDGNARVMRKDGTAFPNLYAGGGAARGISGPGADGYMAGNGLLTATTYGKLAGRDAARVAIKANRTTAA